MNINISFSSEKYCPIIKKQCKKDRCVSYSNTGYHEYCSLVGLINNMNNYFYKDKGIKIPMIIKEWK